MGWNENIYGRKNIRVCKMCCVEYETKKFFKLSPLFHVCSIQAFYLRTYICVFSISTYDNSVLHCQAQNFCTIFLFLVFINFFSLKKTIQYIGLNVYVKVSLLYTQHYILLNFRFFFSTSFLLLKSIVYVWFYSWYACVLYNINP